MERETQSPDMQEVAVDHDNKDSVVRLLEKYEIPVNTENYMGLAFPGQDPRELTAEELLTIPEELRPKLS